MLLLDIILSIFVNDRRIVVFICIAIDCANGANYKIASDVFKRLNANIIPISINNDGYLINENCGANHIENLLEEVKIQSNSERIL